MLHWSGCLLKLAITQHPWEGIALHLKTKLWRQMPPAIFPVCLGFMSLALGWRNAADVMPGISQDIGNLLLGLSTGFFIWFLMFYFAKVAARPLVILDDMKTPPARAGMAAAAMSMMLLAAALIPLNLRVPEVWWTGVAMQIFASAVVLYSISKDRPEARHFSTFQYLTFVGPVIGPIAGVQLGYVTESFVLTIAALIAYVIVTVGIIVTFRRDPLPKNLRPSAMIFLAPVSLFALSFGALEIEWAFTLFYWASNITGLVLLFFVPWMLRGGYTPVWAAFTFPLGAFINVQVLAVSKGEGIWAVFGVYAGLAIGTPVILYLSYRSIMEWVTGDLADKSHAAVA